MYGESVMREITTLGDLKGKLRAGFENDEESLEEFGIDLLNPAKSVPDIE